MPAAPFGSAPPGASRFGGGGGYGRGYGSPLSALMANHHLAASQLALGGHFADFSSLGPYMG